MKSMTSKPPVPSQKSIFFSKRKGKIAFGIVGLSLLLIGGTVAAYMLMQPSFGATEIGAMAAGAMAIGVIGTFVFAITMLSMRARKADRSEKMPSNQFTSLSVSTKSESQQHSMLGNTEASLPF